MRSRYQFIVPDGVYFITTTVVHWMPIFVNDVYCQIIIDSLKYCQKHKDLHLYAYVILENHIHLIVSGLRLSRIIQDFKKYTAHAIIQQLKNDNKTELLESLAIYKQKHKVRSEHQVWQEGYHPELIIDDVMFRQKADYIHYNPVKKGIAEFPEQWKYSSARNYLLDDHRVIRVDCSLI